MKILIPMALISTVLMTTMTFNANANESAKDTSESAQCLSFMQHSEKKLHAKEMLDLCELTAGKPMLIVNTASHCGFTPQFTALEALHK
jgi:glutathione peroxidase